MWSFFIVYHCWYISYISSKSYMECVYPSNWYVTWIKLHHHTIDQIMIAIDIVCYFGVDNLQLKGLQICFVEIKGSICIPLTSERLLLNSLLHAWLYTLLCMYIHCQSQDCSSLVTWSSCKPFSQWQCSFQMKAALPFAVRLALESCDVSRMQPRGVMANCMRVLIILWTHGDLACSG